jgi:hypothetical protein
MSNPDTDTNILKLNKLIFYFALAISFASVAINLLKGQQAPLQAYINSIVSGLLIVLFIVSFVPSFSINLNFILFIYTILGYTILTLLINSGNTYFEYYLFQSTMLIFFLITIIGLMAHHIHILIFGLLYTLSYVLITFFNSYNSFGESLSIIGVFILLFSVFMFLSSQKIKANLKKHVIISNTCQRGNAGKSKIKIQRF